MKTIRSPHNSLALVLTALLLAACWSDDAAFVDLSDEEENGEASLRVIHASRDAPVLHVAVNDASREDNLSYGTSSETIAEEPGETRIAISRATAPEDPLLELELDLTAEERLSLVVFGSLDADELRLAALTEDLDAPPPGEARLVFLNGIHVDGDNWPVDLEASGEVIVSEADYGVWQAPVTVAASDDDSYALLARNQDGVQLTPPANLTPDSASHYLVVAAGIWADGLAETDPEILLLPGFSD